MRSRLPAALLAAFAALATLATPAVAAAGTVTVKGSDTMVVLVQRWAEAFMKANPGTKVQVTGGGSGTGIAALINGTTQVAASSRAMKDAERAKVRGGESQAPVETSVAKDGVTFYVHESNPVAALSVAQLRGIYQGDITNWKEVGGRNAPIVLYSRENNSGTYVFVKDNLLEGEDFSPTAQTLPGTAAVVSATSKEPNAIGYGGAAYVTGVKELKVSSGGDAVEATEENIRSGRYPLSRDLYFYTRGPPTGEVKAFLDFCLSPEGQQLVRKVGYFPIR